MRIKEAQIAAALACTALLAALFIPPSTAQDAQPATISLGPGSALWLEGKSNLHDFESRTTKISVKFTADPNTSVPSTLEGLAGFLLGVRSLDVEVPVTALRSSKAALDKNLWQDLRADKHPTVTFHLTANTVTPVQPGGDTLVIKADGVLTVAGRERPVALTARAYGADQGIWLEGRETLRMTDFGIKPRTMMLGTLRVKDQIVVRYRLLIVPGKS